MKNAFPVYFKDFSLKSQRRMQQDAQRGKWYNLVRMKAGILSNASRMTKPMLPCKEA